MESSSQNSTIPWFLSQVLWFYGMAVCQTNGSRGMEGLLPLSHASCFVAPWVWWVWGPLNMESTASRPGSKRLPVLLHHIVVFRFCLGFPMKKWFCPIKKWLKQGKKWRILRFPWVFLGTNPTPMGIQKKPSARAPPIFFFARLGSVPGGPGSCLAGCAEASQECQDAKLG